MLDIPDELPVNIEKFVVQIQAHGTLDFMPSEWAFCANEPAEKCFGNLTILETRFLENSVSDATVSVRVLGLLQRTYDQNTHSWFRSGGIFSSPSSKPPWISERKDCP